MTVLRLKPGVNVWNTLFFANISETIDIQKNPSTKVSRNLI